jgi:hypothetical protein
MKSYRELEIYKESKRLAVEVHKITLSLPKFDYMKRGVNPEDYRRPLRRSSSRDLDEGDTRWILSSI